MMRHLLSIADLDVDEIEAVLTRAEQILAVGPPSAPERTVLLGTLFLEDSLRTRCGFQAAAARLGWNSIAVSGLREGLRSSPESWADTLRTISGMVDVLVMRPARSLELGSIASHAVCSVINGGDQGPKQEHPTQALVDLFAMRRFVASFDTAPIGLVGDPGMRAARSLMSALARVSTGPVVVVNDPGQDVPEDIAQALGSRLRVGSWTDLADVRALYVIGIPHESLPLDRRHDLLLTRARLDRLRPDCSIFSPLPVVDEIALDVRSDPRMRMFEQSDLGLYVRMAVLERFVASGAARGPDAEPR